MAKTTLHVVLPPLFRLLAQGFTLPNRRFYTPATDYKNVPSEFSPGGGVLRPIPSVMHLPEDLEVEVDVGGSERSTTRRRVTATGTKPRSSGIGNGSLGGDNRRGGLEKNKMVDNYTNGKEGETVQHYDADGEWIDICARA
jgi:dihydrosphingosine 1-phosphate phosphatase